MTYKEFIQNIIDTRGQWNIPEGEYYESHHIIPRCMGGTGRKKTKHENIIWLYPKEHYEAHKLLALENPNSWGLVDAWNRIHFDKRHDDHEITSEEYSLLRERFSKLASEINLGRKDSPEVCKKKSESAKKRKPCSIETRKKLSDGKKGENNPMYGKTGSLSPFYGKTHTDENKKSQSDRMKGRLVGEKNPMFGKENKWGHHTEETKQTISRKNKGRPGPVTRLGHKNSERTNQIISEAQSIKVVDLTTNKIYKSMSEAAEDLDCCIASVSRCVRQKKLFKGHILDYYEDNK